MPNYKNDILIDIIERILPPGLEAWQSVTALYQRKSGETTLRHGEDLRDNWNKKLCNRMQMPTGKPVAQRDRIFRCIAIERRIQDEANAAILGVDSSESSHRRDDGSSFCSDTDIVVAGRGGGNATANVAMEDGVPPIYDIEFNHGKQGDKNAGGDEMKEDEEVAAANAAVVEGGGHPTSAAVSSSSVGGDGQRGGAAGKIKEAGAPPRRSLSSMSNITGTGNQRTKNKKFN